MNIQFNLQLMIYKQKKKKKNISHDIYPLPMNAKKKSLNGKIFVINDPA